jgi:hypothetical protein
LGSDFFSGAASFFSSFFASDFFSSPLAFFSTIFSSARYALTVSSSLMSRTFTLRGGFWMLRAQMCLFSSSLMITSSAFMCLVTNARTILIALGTRLLRDVRKASLSGIV